MNDANSKRDVTKLSAKQQVGLYVVLTKLLDENNRPFYSSDFAREMKSYLLIDDADEYRQTIGGVLGALSKNGLLKKTSGDKDPLWILSEEIHKDAASYKEDILPVVTHWQK
jgi:hypothetical protein